MCMSLVGMRIENRFFFRSEPIVWNRQPNSLTVLLSVLCGVAHAQTFLVSSSDCSKHGRSVLKFGSISHDKNDTYATCNLCKKSISSKGGNTTNMNKHLNTQHGIKLQECHVFDACSSSAKVGASSLSVQGKLLKSDHNHSLC